MPVVIFVSHDLVRRALVTTHTSWRRRAWHREQPTGRLPDFAAPEHADRLDESEHLRRALTSLPPRMRATVVLRYYEDLSELQTAQVMGCSESTVNTQAARGLARLRGGLARSGGFSARVAGSDGGQNCERPMTGEDELRSGLRTLADRSGPPSTDGPTLARRVLRDSADRRRTRRNVAVGLSCAALLGTAVPFVLDRTPPAAVSASAGATAGDSDGAVTATGIVDQPTRGSLSGDTGFVVGVRELPWPDPGPGGGAVVPGPSAPPPEARTVVFAGDVPGGRWALVVGRPTNATEVGSRPSGDLLAVWFTGPSGAAPGGLTLAGGPSSIPSDWPAALSDPRTGTLVVVTAPGDVVEVSERPEIASDGSTSRTYRKTRTEDGVAVTRLRPSELSSSGGVSFRVHRGDRTVARTSPWSVTPGTPPSPVPIDYPRGQPSALGATAAEYAAERVLVEVGLPLEDVDVTAQWVGNVPSTGAGAAAVVTVTLPSGAVVVDAQWLVPWRPDGSLVGDDCGRAVQPAGPPADRRVYALACEVVEATTGAPMRTSLVVVAPRDVVLVRAYDEDRTFLSEHPSADGTVVVPLPLGTETVEAVTAGGVSLGRVELLGHSADFGD